MEHPLHHIIAEAIRLKFNGQNYSVYTDVDCESGDERQRLPLFIGSDVAAEARMCCVDILIASHQGIRVVIEIDESSLHPTQICGKFLTSALATHYIHKPTKKAPLPLSEETLFVQVLDSNKWNDEYSRKREQAALIDSQINKMLPLKNSSISRYRLFAVAGKDDNAGVAAVVEDVSEYLGRVRQ